MHVFRLSRAKRASSATISLAAIVLLQLAACDDESSPDSTPMADGGSNDGSTTPPNEDPADGGSNDASPDSSAPTGEGCTGLAPASELAAPGAGKSVMLAALCEASSDYNGLTTNLTSVELASGAVKNEYVLSLSAGESANRSLIIQFEDPNVGPGTTDFPEVFGETQFVYNDSRTGTTAKAYFCHGPVTIDSLEDKLYRYHFDVTCNAAPSSAAAGNIRMTGYGASRLL